MKFAVKKMTFDFNRPDVALAPDDTTRFMPWLMAFMVFLAALSIAGFSVLGSAARTIDRGIEDTVTVQIPAGANAKADEERIAGALALLRQMPGVLAAESLPREKVVSLLEPWLGAAARSNEIPLPWVIDLRVDRAHAPSAGAIAKALEPYMSGVQVDDHGVWLQALLRAVRSIEWIGAVVIALIGLAAIATVIFVTRAGMGLHRDTIEVMHFVGAQDSYVARQFALRASILGLKGSLIGVALAGPSIVLLSVLVGDFGFGLLPEVQLGIGAWTAILALVPIASTVALVTARMTVLKSLQRMV